MRLTLLKIIFMVICKAPFVGVECKNPVRSFHAKTVLRNFDCHSGLPRKSSKKKSFYRPRTKYEGRYCFHRCLSVNISGGRGYPILGLSGGVSHSRSGWGRTPSQVSQGVPVPGLDRRVPCPRLWGYPIPGMGGGYSNPGLDGGGYPMVPPSQVWMVGVLRVPPTGTGWGTPSPTPLDRAA